MDVLPEDLGEAWHLEITRRRAGGREEPRALTRLEKRWVDGQGLSEPIARASARGGASGAASAVAIALGASFVLAQLLHPILPVGADVLAGLAAGAGVGGAALLNLPRASVRRLHAAPVTDTELVQLLKTVAAPPPAVRVDPVTDFITKLLGVSTTPLAPREVGPEEAFLTLVRELSRMEGIPAENQAALRETLRSIGNAVGALPEIQLPEVDPAELIAEARYILRRAEGEYDQIVEASLVRQARALVDQSKAVERTVTLARRTRVLRRELMRQIDSLRAALPSLTRTAAVASEANAHFGAVQRVAESVRGVAREAESVADAREELAVTLDPSWRASGEAAQILRLGRNG